MWALTLTVASSVLALSGARSVGTLKQNAHRHACAAMMWPCYVQVEVRRLRVRQPSGRRGQLLQWLDVELGPVLPGPPSALRGHRARARPPRRARRLRPWATRPAEDSRSLRPPAHVAWIDVDPATEDLVYGVGSDGSKVPDFSHVGYHSGEVPLPSRSRVRVLAMLAANTAVPLADDTARRQARRASPWCTGIAGGPRRSSSCAAISVTRARSVAADAGAHSSAGLVVRRHRAASGWRGYSRERPSAASQKGTSWRALGHSTHRPKRELAGIQPNTLAGPYLLSATFNLQGCRFRKIPRAGYPNTVMP